MIFDPDWQANGYMEQAVTQFETWCLSQNTPGMTLDIVRIPDRTPLIFIDIPGSIDNTVLLYGHLDKQPESRTAKNFASFSPANLMYNTFNP